MGGVRMVESQSIDINEQRPAARPSHTVLASPRWLALLAAAVGLLDFLPLNPLHGRRAIPDAMPG
jgi:hypothetical protein